VRAKQGTKAIPALTALGVGALLLVVFLWYFSPHFVVSMAGRLWSCI
jgi:hypothetical protein